MSDAVTASGRLPDGWRWGRVGEVCEINPRRPSIDRSDETPTTFIPMEAVDAKSGVADSHVRPFGEIKKGYTYFAEGDVLFAKITPCMQNGKHAIARDLLDGIGFGTTEFHVLRPGEHIIAEWMHFFVRQPSVLLEAIEHFTGSVGQQRLPQEYLFNRKIPLPPLAEQRRIVAILKKEVEAVEKARAAAHDRLEAVRALPAAFLRDVFPQSDESLPDGWQWVMLGEVCEVIGGSTPDTGNSSYWNGKIAWVTPTDLGKLSDIAITETERYITHAGLESCGARMLPTDAVVMSSRAPIGHLAITGTSLCTNQGCKSFVPNIDIDSLFLYWALKRAIPDIQALGSGATFSEVSKSALERFAIPLPLLAEQQRIAAILKQQMLAVEKAQAMAAEELDAIDAMPSALLRKAFAGKV